RSAGAGGDSRSAPASTSTTHSLHLPLRRQEVGTRIPSASALSKSVTPTGAVVSRSLMERRTGTVVLLPVGRSFELTGDGLCHLGSRSLACLLVAPAPLGKIVVGALEAALGRQCIDAHEKLLRHRHRHLVARIVFGPDLRRHFLPVEDLVCRHRLNLFGRATLQGRQARPGG